MENSILKSTKKILGLPETYTEFDLDVLTFIGTVFSTLHQLGIGPDAGLMVEDESTTWDELGEDDPMTNMIKTYTYLRVRMLFDPPSTSFAINAMNEQIEAHEVRLSYAREAQQPLAPDPDPLYPNHDRSLGPDETIVYVPIETYMEGGY